MRMTPIAEVQLLNVPLGPDARGHPVVAVLDEAGGRGLGEGPGNPPDEVEEMLAGLSGLMLGRRPADREGLRQAMTDAAGDWEGDPRLIGAVLCAVDTALWDLASRQLGVPGVVLMGGLTRYRVEVCVDCGSVTDEQHVARARAALEAGVRAFAVETPDAAPAHLAALRALRRIIGPQALMAIRVQTPADGVEAATEAGARLDRLDPYWVEGLVREGRWEDLAQVRAATAAPVGAGGATVGLRRFSRALATDCADVLTCGLAPCGGPSAALKLADAADLRGIRVSPGADATVISALAAGAVCFARACASPVRMSFAVLEALGAAVPDLVRDGFLAPGDAPGLTPNDLLPQGAEPVLRFDLQAAPEP